MNLILGKLWPRRAEAPCRKPRTATVAVLLAACVFASGCASKATTTASSSAADAKPTPAQQAAAQHGDQLGPAVYAANQADQTGK